MPDPVRLSEAVTERLRALSDDGRLGADEVLRLLLGLPPAAAPAESGPGFEDATYAVRFPAGFEIFRVYKGRPYRARVEGGRWRLDADGRAYDSLNQLSQAVIDGNENAWMFWHFRGPDGRPKRIAALRDPARVQRRPRRRKPARLAVAAASAPAASAPRVPSPAAPAAFPAVVSPATPPAEAPPPADGMAWQPRPKGR